MDDWGKVWDEAIKWAKSKEFTEEPVGYRMIRDAAGVLFPGEFEYTTNLRRHHKEEIQNQILKERLKA